MAENAHALLHYHEQGSNLMEAAGRLASNKLSPLARGAMELATGRNYAGQSYANATDRVRAAVTDALPFPLPVGSLVEKDPRGIAGSGPVTGVRSAADKALAPLGYRVNRQPGSVARQVAQGFGFKLMPAQGARAQMFDLAKEYRAKPLVSGGSGQPPLYTELRRALDNDDTTAARDELRHLLDGGKTLRRISEAMGIGKGGSIRPEQFTGSHATEQTMLRHLTTEQRAIYEQAQRDHHESASRFQQLFKMLPQSKKDQSLGLK